MSQVMSMSVLSRCQGFGNQSSAVKLLIAVVVLSVVYMGNVLALLQFWWDSNTFDYGLLLPFVAIYLIYHKRDALQGVPYHYARAGIPLLFFCSLFVFLAHYLGVQTVEVTAMIAMYPLLVWTFLGNAYTKRVLFPLLLTFLAAPVWNVLGVPLQMVTAHASVFLLRLTGMPLLMNDYYITIPAGRFLIETACGGLNFFMSALVISSVFCFMHDLSLRRSTLYVSVALLVAIVLNWIRVIAIVWIGQLSNMQNPLVNDHNTFGQILFGIVMVILLLVGVRVVARGRPKALQNRSSEESATVSETSWSIPVVAILSVSLVPLLLFMGSFAWSGAPSYQMRPLQIETLQEYPPLPDPDWAPVYRGATQAGLSVFRVQDQRISLYRAYYARQHQGAELINELNTRYQRERWRHINESVRHIQIAAGASIPVQEAVLGNETGKSRLVWSFYFVSGRVVVRPVKAKLLEILKLFGGDPGSSVTAISIDYMDDLDAARQALQGFLVTVYPQVKSSLVFNP